MKRTSPVHLAMLIAAALGLGAARADDRLAIEVPPEGRDLVLDEMRTMLASVRGIVAGLAENDMARVAEAARASGTATAVDLAPELRQRLPAEFKQLGISVHEAFDELADLAESGASTHAVLTRLRAQLDSCVACHATFRLAPPGETASSAP